MNIKKLTLTAFFAAIAVAGSLYRRSGRYRYYRRHAVLSDCRSADGQSDGSFIHLCCTISDQYCWRHDHGHCDHNDNEANKGAGQDSAADQQLNVREWERPSL